MTKTTRFEKDELDQSKTIRDALATVIAEAGEILIQRSLLAQSVKELDQKEELLMTRYDALSEQETELITRLSQKYGEGTLNLETGEFTATTN